MTWLSAVPRPPIVRFVVGLLLLYVTSFIQAELKWPSVASFFQTLAFSSIIYSGMYLARYVKNPPAARIFIATILVLWRYKTPFAPLFAILNEYVTQRWGRSIGLDVLGALQRISVRAAAVARLY